MTLEQELQVTECCTELGSDVRLVVYAAPSASKAGLLSEGDRISGSVCCVGWQVCSRCGWCQLVRADALYEPVIERIPHSTWTIGETAAKRDLLS
jgi:hypothetical protein